MYFIVEVSYDDCFKVFFQDELGYPNFYRMSEILPISDSERNVTLVAPYGPKETHKIEHIKARIAELGLKSVAFGGDLETSFSFDHQGKLQLHPLFKQALTLAMDDFDQYRDDSASASAA